jgi:hypothetical protein
MSKNKGGRPSIVFTPEQVAQVEALAAYLSIPQICDYFGISQKSISNIKDRQPEVFTAYVKGRAKAIASVAQKGIIQKALEGDSKAAMFYLRTQAGWVEPKGEPETSEQSSVRVEFLAPRKD